MGMPMIAVDPGPCPMCEAPRSAIAHSSTWGHDFSCCSDACGLAYGSTSKRWAAEVGLARREAAAARARVRECERELKAAQAREVRAEQPSLTDEAGR